MKLSNKLAFGVTSVISGQKSSVLNAEPQLIANSTKGKFKITTPISKALGIAVGESIQFVNNIEAVMGAIASREASIVEFAQANDLDLESKEGVDAVLAEFVFWGIAKGHQLFDSKGNALQVHDRYTVEQKKAYIAEHAQEILEENRAALIELVGDEDATDEELIAAITVETIETPLVNKMQGSKTATTGMVTGVGAQLDFTDSNVWAVLKKDLAEPETINRAFDVLVDEPQTVELHNGYQMVSVKVLPFEFASDEAPVKRVVSDKK